MAAEPEYERAAADLVLDRMEIEDVGGNPARLADAVHRQIGHIEAAVPVRAIARALSICKIREEPLVGIEAALATTPERGEGMIAVKRAANRQRQRFSIGHELGRFLDPRHQGAWDGEFRCNRNDLNGSRAVRGPRPLSPFELQERQANEFAIELLAPLNRIRPYLDMEPSLEAARDLANGLDLSREAAFRRYAERHNDSVAIVFARDDRFTYAVRSASFPRLVLQRDDRMPWLPQGRGVALMTDVEATDPTDWVQRGVDGDMSAQTLYQEGQRSTTLLIHQGDDQGDDTDNGLEDTVERLGRFKGSGV